MECFQIMKKKIEKIQHASTRVVTTAKKGVRLGEGVLNGIVGDRLHDTFSGLSRSMQWYKEEAPLALTSDNIGVHYPKASPKVCILVHGLINDETAWNFAGQPSENYGSRLQDDFGYTPFYVRYNTGLHISQNGQLLSQLIQQLMDIYPVAVEDITIIAHSMGGLVVRSACHYAPQQGADWTEKIRKIFFLGTPHLGAPLEKFGNVVTYLLKKIPLFSTKLTGDIINLRSAGIKDLRYGYLTDEDWQNHHPDELLTNRKTVVPLLEHVSYFVITGTLTGNKDSLASRWFGDALVRKDSATGKACDEHHLPFVPEHHREFTGLVHHKLVHAPEVYAQIRGWM